MSAPTQAPQDAATTGTNRRADRAPKPDESQTHVLMQRVIALGGVVEPSQSAVRPATPLPALKPPPRIAPHVTPVAQAEPPRPAQDLSSTALEWGPKPAEPKAPSPVVPQAQAPQESVDAQWATYSSISLQPDELLLSQRLLSMSIEDAVTQQYQPRPTANVLASGSSITDLASLDRALESAGVLEAHELELITRIRQAPAPARPAPAAAAPAPAPAPDPQPSAPQAQPQARMLVVPASIAWIVAGAFAVCSLVLAYLVTAFLVCGQPSLLDPIRLRCIAQADVAHAR